MTKLGEYVQNVDFTDKNFIGTVAFRSEELTLPDGSKMALGIDDGHWVLVYQEMAGGLFRVYEYNQHGNKINVDKKAGTVEDIKAFKKHVKYFLANVSTDDLVTLLPPQSQEKL
ncbi:MAG: hypothetical protein PHH14_00755 [Candidatus Margulisbacteria bacterium]|nr:hypothetical protein [Candidatus Margulisiibacteriota bacterium]